MIARKICARTGRLRANECYEILDYNLVIKFPLVLSHYKKAIEMCSEDVPIVRCISLR